MKKILPIIAATAVLAVFSCNTDDKDKGGFTDISLGDKTIAFDEAIAASIPLTATDRWVAISDAGWLSAEPARGTAGTYTVTVTATKNEGDSERTGEISFTCGPDTRKMKVTQGFDTTPHVEPEPDAPYITDHFSDKMHFSTGRLRTTSAVMQSFDIDFETNTIYYSQLNRKFRAYVSAAAPNYNSTPQCMTLNYFGHVSNFSIEKTGGQVYIWVDNFSSKNASGDYWYSPVISRVPFKLGTTLTSWDAPENYYFGEKNISVAVDIEGDMLTYLGITTGNCRTYRLSELRALPVVDITLDPVTYGGEDGAPNATEVTKAHTIKARDCTKAKPIGEFNIPRGKYSNGETISWQGFDIKGGLVYQMQGNGHSDGTPSPGWLQIRGINGETVLPLTKITALEDLSALKAAGITDTGYMEPEGVKVHGDYIYIGFASKKSNDERRGTIFRFAKKAVKK